MPTTCTSDSSFLEVRPTKSGRGVFARVPLPAGTALLAFSGPTLCHAQTHPDLHCVQVGPDRYLGPSGGLDDLVNHSCEPNSGLRISDRDIVLVAIRDIAQGEELLWDYSTTMDEDDFEFDCLCGAGACRGRVRDFRHLPEALQQRYAAMGIVPAYNRRYLVKNA